MPCIARLQDFVVVAKEYDFCDATSQSMAVTFFIFLHTLPLS